MRKEWIWIIVLSILIALLIPWTLQRWDHGIEGGDSFKIRVKQSDGSVETMDLEDYLIGVVAAEMPAEFEIEALKSQAIAARTYAAKRLSQPVTPDPGYDLDTTVKTQAWMSEKEMRSRWGFIAFYRYHSRIEKAVKNTKGLVLVFNGEYADTFYHSSTGRKPTEKAEEVWSSSRPYLTNVNAGEENPLRFVRTQTFTPDVLYQKLGIQGTPRPLSEQDFLVISKTTTGRLRHVRILGKGFLATQLRTLLGLSSTDIEWSVSPQQVVFKTYGNGHAVGMSQYGANDLAKKGYGFEEILEHFYPSTKMLSLTKVSN